MFYTRGLLLKGILGFGAASAAAYGGLTQKERIVGWFSGNEETAKPAEAITETISKLLENVGLECQGLESANETTGVDCSKKADSGNIKVKREGSAEFDVSTLPADSGGGKIKVYKVEDKGENGYAGGLKLVIEGGNINGGDGNNKLEEFETYEIKEETNSSNPATKAYYLNRKTKASDKIKVLLGLDTCDFPGDACSLTTEQIKKIKFDGKDGEVTGTGTLQISIASANETQDFPYGFKFTLTPSGGNISIPRGTGKDALTLNTSSPTVFNIKKTGSSLTLEESLTQDALAKKVGLSCPTEATAEGVDCSKVESSNIKVKQDSTDFDVTTAPTGNTKIKLYKVEGTDYNKNLKFVIEGGDINGGSDSNKLEEFETYEIKEDSSSHKYYLTRKDKSKDSKRKILGLPDTCTFPESSSASANCTLDSTNIDKIKFDGKTSATLTAESGTATLKVEVVSSDDTDFPLGFKFTLTPGTGSTLTINRSGSAEAITIKANEGKEFKIKKSGTSLTLEKAWTLDTLAKKVNLSCTASTGAPTETNGVECTKKTESSDNIKVKKNSTDFNVSTISGGKIKVYKASTGEDHNEGFKFVIEENDINGSDNSNKLEQFETYEIKKEGSDWRLVRKEDAKNGIKKALDLPTNSDCDLPANGSEKTCTLDDAKFKKIKFDGKGSVTETVTGNPKLKISKQTGSESGDYGPFGYKFVLDSDGDVKISDSVTIKGKTNTEFKIKRAQSSNEISLEKAWTVKSLGAKVGLECPDNGETESNKECSLKTSNVNLKIDDTKKYTGLSKKSNGDAGEKKVKYAVGEREYNQGFKFTVDSEISLEGGSNGGDDKKIENSGATYQILKDSADNNWYLTKKKPAPAA